MGWADQWLRRSSLEHSYAARCEAKFVRGLGIIKNPLIVAMLAVPILIQVLFNSALAYLLNRLSGVAHCVA